MDNATVETRRQSLGEEIANSVTHGIGTALGVAALAILVTFSALHGNVRHILVSIVFGLSLIILYLNSTLYHALTHHGAKRVFRVLDHASIYVLIAGTYTPFTVVTLRGAWGWSLFGAVWALAAAGIVYQSLLIGRMPHLSTTLYVLMGWLVVIAARPLLHALPWHGVLWLVAGGVSYTLGVAFFAWRWKYAHMVWHLFVIAGSVCHFLAVLWYVVP
jgi:hemolysin III